jgi:hypothetical protein
MVGFLMTARLSLGYSDTISIMFAATNIQFNNINTNSIVKKKYEIKNMK